MKRILAIILLCLLAAGSAKKQSAQAASSTPSIPCCRIKYLLLQAATDIAPPSTPNANITVDYPSEGSIFPPDMIAPLFQWRDANKEATVWRVEVSFGERAPHLKIWSSGEKMEIGFVDLELVGFVPPKLTPEQEAGHSWRPDQKTWEAIRKHSVSQPAIVRFSGFRSRQDGAPVSDGQVTLQTSNDPVGAPIFYRDVPQLPPPTDAGERGVIKPLPDSVLPKIRWRLRSVSEPQSKVVMEGLSTCANCHSVSRDGKTLGIDVDGPQNDKGLYAMIPIRKVSSISNDYVIHWSTSSEDRAQKRYGFMSQVSPDGRYVVNSIAPPHSTTARIVDRLYNGSYGNYGFGQVFYPTRGILGWYSKDTGKLEPLPGADDPYFVHTSGFWSPDGKYIVFSRGVAREPYQAGPKSMYANDPNETQMQYDLYRIPFNEGKGGKAERVIGASENGLSNNFPKVSPDGKWIIFVQNKNGLLMRPDSRLFIVPFEGGEARPLRSNLPTMNSWHSFSPNGRWLVFSSKSQSANNTSKDPDLYTRMYLTHIDANGSSSPAIRVEDATAANRAVNIPEFVNIAADGLERIDAPATQFYKLFDAAVSLSEKHQFGAAIPAWRKALELDPLDPRAHNNLGIALVASGQTSEALDEYRKSLELNASSSQTENNLGSALAESGNLVEAKAHFEKALQINPDNGAAEVDLGNALLAQGGHLDEAIEHLKKGIENQGQSPDGQNGLGVALARSGKLDEGILHLEKAVEMVPQNAGFHYNLGRILAAALRFPEALPQFESAARLSGMQDPAALQMLAAMYSENNRYADAVITARTALDLARRQHNDSLAAELSTNLARYQSQSSATP